MDENPNFKHSLAPGEHMAEGSAHVWEKPTSIKLGKSRTFLEEPELGVGVGLTNL